MTHDDLVKQAFWWLRERKRCSVIASQLVSGSDETPDVIGWHGWTSTLIEAKITISDFRADQRKMFRKYEQYGMGIFRYYIIPFELKEDALRFLPERWGLILCKPRDVAGYRLIVEKGSMMFENDKNKELLLMSSVIRRIAGSGKPFQGVSVRCYTIETAPNPKAELFVEPSGEVSI